jgi:peptidoglycan/xylan/chitin deacetylase (PgdA/CDA1 family)
MNTLWAISGLAALTWLIWFSWRYAWWRPAIDQRHPRILMYHMICDPIKRAGFNGMRVSPHLFEQQVRWLKENGWRFFTLTTLLEQGSRIPEKSVAITFDDGFADNCTTALPILKKYDACATLFLVVNRHHQEWSMHKKRHHDSGELMREPKLSDSQVMELIESGCVEIGSHTMTHPNFGLMDTEAKKMEMLQSKELLESKFGINIKAFAYPFGILQPEDPGLARGVGYLGAVTTEPGISDWDRLDPFLLQRIKISGKEGMLAFRMRLRTGWRGANK